MIEIDRSKCKKMLVWNDDERDAVERIVVCFDGKHYLCVNKSSEEKFKQGENYIAINWDNAKPLPEPKPMTALDAMWWAGIRRVYKYYNGDRMMSIRLIGSTDNLDDYRWNELIRENGETKLKYEEWKPFNFDECDMGEG